MLEELIAGRLYTGSPNPNPNPNPIPNPDPDPDPDPDPNPNPKPTPNPNPNQASWLQTTFATPRDGGGGGAPLQKVQGSRSGAAPQTPRGGTAAGAGVRSTLA